ncbi:MAG TPA: hypothetical protein VF711_09055, partial [Acidimicrobiales bacterium]
SAFTGTTQATTSTTIPPPLVVTKVDPKLGEILADSAGMTLYTLTANDVAVACETTCPSVWPPLEVPVGGSLPTGGIGVGPLGVAPGPNNTLLVTSGGLPLYRFTQDKTPADVNGEGIKSFGGTWRVVKAGASATSTTTSSTTTTAAPRTTDPPGPETTEETAPDTTVETTIATTIESPVMTEAPTG